MCGVFYGEEGRHCAAARIYFGRRPPKFPSLWPTRSQIKSQFTRILNIDREDCEQGYKDIEDSALITKTLIGDKKS